MKEEKVETLTEEFLTNASGEESGLGLIVKNRISGVEGDAGLADNGAGRLKLNLAV